MQAEPGLIDLRLATSYTPQADDDAAMRIANQHGPQIHTSCWSADSNTVYISGNDIQGDEIPITSSDPQSDGDQITLRLMAKPTLHEKIPNWFAINIEQPDLMYVVKSPYCIPKPPPAWRFGSDLDSTPERWFENSPELQRKRERMTRGLQVVQDSNQALSLQSGDGKVLAKHQTTSFWSTHISISTYIWSSDGSRIAYVTNEMAGSMTGPDNRAYVVDLNGPAKPEWIATDTEAMYWHGNDTLFACLYAGNDDVTSIARWQF